MYVGNWRILKGNKVKHGSGKITCPGADANLGGEEYDGEWVDDKMEGQGRYVFASGSTYTGNWKAGMMHGKGLKKNPDGTYYDGEWEQNLYHGEGTFVDEDKCVWTGLFIQGTFDSKIQKKLKVDKEI